MDKTTAIVKIGFGRTSHVEGYTTVPGLIIYRTASLKPHTTSEYPWLIAHIPSGLPIPHVFPRRKDAAALCEKLRNITDWQLPKKDISVEALNKVERIVNELTA